MELYFGPSSDFVDLATTNVIADRLKVAWFDHHGFNPSPSEQRSWRNSLRALANVLNGGGFLDHGVLVEYQLPLSSLRLDAMITGLDHESRPGAVIVELKQWSSDVEPSPVDELVTVQYGKAKKEQLHPSAQARQYRMYLADTHESFHDGGIELGACSFLHDFMHDDQSELLSPRHANILGITPLFAGDRVDDLVQYLDDRLGGGSGLGVLKTVREGRYRPHRKLLEHTAAMVEAEPSYVLLDEQQVIFKSIMARVAEAVDTDTKTVFIIRGGPGTGKSVLAINLLGELSKAGYIAHHATGSSAFTNTVRKIVGTRAAQQFKFFNSYLNASDDELDVLVCDEAHRIRHHSWNRWTKKKAEDADRPQIDELLSVAKVAVFFIDDLQAVRRNEIGSSADIETLAEEMGAAVHEHRLEAQFRCGGSDGFVRWVENTLGIRRTANALWDGREGFDFDVVDSVEELEAMVRSRNDDGHSGRMMAGYCWAWSNPEGGHLVDDVKIGEWSAPWNARPNATGLAAGIPKSHLWASEDGGLDQVGCIYTAQGFEFDYAGVIWGTDLVYRFGEGWIGRPEFSHDGAMRRGTDQEEFTRLVKNTYRVLLSRGLQGCYVHFLDDQTKHFVMSRMQTMGVEQVLAAETGEDYE